MLPSNRLTASPDYVENMLYPSALSCSLRGHKKSPARKFMVVFQGEYHDEKKTSKRSRPVIDLITSQNTLMICGIWYFEPLVFRRRGVCL